MQKLNYQYDFTLRKFWQINQLLSIPTWFENIPPELQNSRWWCFSIKISGTKYPAWALMCHFDATALDYLRELEFIRFF